MRKHPKYMTPEASETIIELCSVLTMSLSGGTENPGKNTFLQCLDGGSDGDEQW